MNKYSNLFNTSIVINIIYIKNKVFGYIAHLNIILLIKKISKQWGTIPIFFYKPMSDNIHYVNLTPNQHSFSLKVVCRPYFAKLLRKISRGGGMSRGATPQLPKILKSLSFQRFRQKKIKKGVMNYA